VDAVALEGMATSLTLSPLAASALAASASSGRMLPQPDLVVGRTLLHAVELPGLDDGVPTQPRLSVVACGEGAGWRAAPLLLSLDGGATWTEIGATAAPAVIGTIEAPFAAATATLVDEAGMIVVALTRADMALGDAAAAALNAGANLALVGNELIQFGRAEPLGGARWRLSRLWRGRRATQVSAGAAGDRFALLTAATVRTVDLPLTALGGDVQVMAAGIGDGDDPPVAVATVSGASVLPPPPVHLRWTAEDDGGATVTWTRRSRAGGRWLDRVEAPLAEESEGYRVSVGAREVLVTAPTIRVTPDERSAGPVVVMVRQRGTHGESATVMIEVEGL
jgi:hypothetical protein